MSACMQPDWVYYVVGLLLVLANIAAWVSTFFTLPGNWIIVGLMALTAFFLPAKENGLGIEWTAVIVLTVLAGIGELLEFFAGAAGAAKQGASRRSMVLSLVGAAVGSIVGAMVGLPVPLFGTIIGALGGGAGGAYVGAYVGEMWKGRQEETRVAVSRAALVGRLMGTIGKLIVGILMVVLATAAMFLFRF